MEIHPQNFTSLYDLNHDRAICDAYCDAISNPYGWCLSSCFHACPLLCKHFFVYTEDFHRHPPPPPPPPPPLPPLILPSIPRPSHPDDSSVYLKEAGMLTMACMIGIAIISLVVFLIMAKLRSRRNSPGTSPSFQFREEFRDENQGPVLDHPIWYINTVGLQQSVIDSITIFKYRKEEGLIDGTECSVCLSEFKDDESLRLLPKCNHAFHIPCIDTWLRSHKNCPMCRAPIVNQTNPGSLVSTVSVTEQNPGDSSSNQETRVEISETNSEVEANMVEEGGLAENMTNCHPRNPSDLVENRLDEEEEEVVEPVRRSVSMDSSGASMIYNVVRINTNPNNEGNSDLEDRGGSWRGKVGIVANRRDISHSANSRPHKLASIGVLSLQKGPVLMKRSFSFSRRFVPSRHFRSQSSILPL